MISTALLEIGARDGQGPETLAKAVNLCDS